MVINGFSSIRRLSLAAATLAAAASLGLAGAASASTIYSDSFVQASGTQLNGQTVQTSATYAGGTSGATWIADTGITTNGSNAVNLASRQNMYLPFTPEAGFIYTLTATLNDTTANSDGGWLAAGFAPKTAIGSGFYNNNFDWALVRNTAAGTAGGTPQYFGGPAVANSSSLGTTADNGLQTLMVTLNTSAAAWTGSATINGSSASYTYATNPTITDVALGAWTDGGTISGFSLTAVPAAAVPEPSSLGLAAAGAVGAMLLLKRRVGTVGR